MSPAGAQGAPDGVHTGEGGTSSDQEPKSPTSKPSGGAASVQGDGVGKTRNEDTVKVVRGVASVPVRSQAPRPDPSQRGASTLPEGGERTPQPDRAERTSPEGGERRPQPGSDDRTQRRNGAEPNVRVTAPATVPSEGAGPDPADPAERPADRRAEPASRAAGEPQPGQPHPSADEPEGQGPAGSDPAVPDGDAGAESDSDDAPATSSGRLPGRDPIWARTLVVLGTVLVLLAGGSITAQKVLANRYDRAVHRDVLIAPGARAGQGPHRALTGPLNFLLIGSDARDGSPDAGQRSDTAIILHIPATLDRAYLISIPRDLRVDIPPDPSIGYEGARGVKINGAFQSGGGGRGGVQLLSATLNQLTGVSFDGAAVIDFAGFRKVVGLLGGVNMCIDERTESHHIGFDTEGKVAAPWTGSEGTIRVHDVTPYVYEEGCRRLEPWQALDYVRQRKSIPDGDYGRQRHQQQFLRAILDEAIRQGVARNPIKADAFIQAVGDSLTVDTNGMPLDELVYGLRNVDPGSLVGIRLPSAPQDIAGYSYVLADEVLAPSLYAAIRDDTLDDWVTANASWVNPL